MPIDISGPNAPHTQGRNDGTQVKPVQQEPGQQQKESGRSSTADTVRITDAANKLNQLEITLDKTPVVDSQRVEALRSAIEEGRYQVEPGRVAEKLIALEQQLQVKTDKK